MSAQVWLCTNLVRLQKAVLCANCEVISEDLNGHCAGCGSQSLLGLSRVLGGQLSLNCRAASPRLRMPSGTRTCAFTLYPQRPSQ